LLALLPRINVGKGGCLPDPEVAERVNACWQYSSETMYIGLSPQCQWGAPVKQVSVCDAGYQRQQIVTRKVRDIVDTQRH
jgi:hypothetical protein